MNESEKYNPQDFEALMMELWEKEKVYQTVESRRLKVEGQNSKAYCLSMFPYPSGAGLHVGHVRIYTGTDVMARYFKMMDKDVLHPMGWDAFGLPAENAAIKAKKNPMDMVPGNIANFKRQMNMLGYSYDWSREFSTTDPSYYKWTQWLFMQFFKMGLLYKRNTPINFCPKCKTGLAEEEVLGNGTHERCGSEITKKELPQWIFRITAYADRLLKDLDLLDWPKGILEMQRNWIGKKEGVIIHHKVKDLDLQIDTFSAYPAWLFADTFIVIAPEHPLVQKLVAGTEYEEKTKNFIFECNKLTTQQRTEDKFEKKGVFTGRYAMDPFNPGREMPIWVANFALMDFGTGIIRCSAHDVRDYDFAQKYSIHLEEVVERTDKNTPINAHDNTGVLVNSGPFTGRSINYDLIEDIRKWIVEQKIGKTETTYHLRDWIFSRQRYWGEPIPMVHCETCKNNDQNTNALIIHGTWGNGNGNWFPWLVNHLTLSGVDAVSPTLPDAKLPRYEERMRFLSEKYSKYTRPSSIVIGHSSGAGTALHIAQENKIDQLVLVAPVLYVDSAYKPVLVSAFDQQTGDALDDLYNKHTIDWEKIKKNVRKITVVFGENDPYLPKEMKPFAEKNFGVENVHVVPGKAHFSLGTKDSKEQFELLRFIEVRSVKGWTMIQESELPLELPYTKSYEPTDSGESPLSAIKGFKESTCPICGGKATRETDTMPNWAGSCWYFLQFAMQIGENNQKSKIKNQNLKEEWLANQNPPNRRVGGWLPVDWYLGGAEHAVLHLLYARFWVKALQDLGLLTFPEPFLRLRNVGMVLAEDHRKMSKSWGNTINPDDVVAHYGADTLRIYEMFMAPFNMEIAWSTSALQGAHRFVKRVWNLYASQKSKVEGRKSDAELIAKLNKTIQKVGDDIAQTKFNTAIAAMMEFLNEYEAQSSTLETRSLLWEEAKKFLQIMAPFAPFVTEKIWRMNGEATSIHLSHWPPQTKVNIKETSVTVPIQINGKFRGTITIQGDPSQDEVEKSVLADTSLQKYIDGKSYTLIYVKGKIANFVVKS